MQRHPVPHAHADGGDFILENIAHSLTLIRAPHPDADAVVAPFAADIEGGQRIDDPLLDGGDEAADVRRAALEVEHDIADPLAGAVIGELAAASGHVDWKSRLDQFGRPCRRAGGVEGGVLEEPDQFRRLATGDRFGARGHGCKRGVIGHGRIAYQPFDRRRAGGRV